MSEERLYTHEQAIKLGKRAICETKGHVFDHYYHHSINGKKIIERHYCDVCDVRINFEYPEL